MNQVLVICGPTATGKTALALKLALKFNGELLAADSRQVYRGMDIGTGKDVTGILGYDLVDPNASFSLADYRTFALKALDEIISRGHLPILVGGTGLYLHSLFMPPATIAVKPNLKLRACLAGKSIVDLQNILNSTNPQRFNQMNNSDKQNPRRLIRAIEVGRSSPSFPVSPVFDCFWVGLTMPLPKLDTAITQRVLSRATPAFTREINQLVKHYPHFAALPAASATGYREWLTYLTGKMSLEATQAVWVKRECQYARRQMTWFKRKPFIHWFDVAQTSWELPVVSLIKTWYAHK